jgi:cell shape-determining protein MreD
MDPISSYHTLIEDFVVASGLTDKMVHVHVGMAIFLCAQVVLRTRRGSIDALLIVLVAEAFNEMMDRMYFGSWRIDDTIGDVVATLFWPTMFVLVSRFRRRRWAVRKSKAEQLLEATAARAGEARGSGMEALGAALRASR